MDEQEDCRWGIDCIRSRGYIWFEVENEKGVYNFMLYCVVYLPS